ncbi:hypothetical protein ACVIHF_008733 [Bradyrhizobium sp. USDA 4506]
MMRPTANSGTAGAQNRLRNYYSTGSREDLTIDTRTQTDYGPVRTFFDSVFTWNSGGYAGAGTTAANGSTAYSGATVAGGTLGVYYTFMRSRLGASSAAAIFGPARERPCKEVNLRS